MRLEDEGMSSAGRVLATRKWRGRRGNIVCTTAPLLLPLALAVLILSLWKKASAVQPASPPWLPRSGGLHRSL